MGVNVHHHHHHQHGSGSEFKYFMSSDKNKKKEKELKIHFIAFHSRVRQHTKKIIKTKTCLNWTTEVALGLKFSSLPKKHA